MPQWFHIVKRSQSAQVQGKFSSIWWSVNTVIFTLNSKLAQVSNSKTIVGGVVPREYIPSVEAGLKDAMENGVLAVIH